MHRLIPRDIREVGVGIRLHAVELISELSDVALLFGDELLLTLYLVLEVAVSLPELRELLIHALYLFLLRLDILIYLDTVDLHIGELLRELRAFHSELFAAVLPLCELFLGVSDELISLRERQLRVLDSLLCRSDPLLGLRKQSVGIPALRGEVLFQGIEA